MSVDEGRLTKLELSLMHLQNDFESLNSVVLENSRRLETMAKAIEQLTDRLAASSTPESVRKAEDEIPPHY